MANTSERTAKLEAIAQRNTAEAARAKEAEARKTAETVTDYLVEAFRSPDPARDGREITIAETLDQMTSTMDESLADQPLVKARLLNAIGRSYSGLGLPKKAIDVLEEAIRLRTARLDQDHPDTLTTMNNLADAYAKARQFDKALPLFELTLQRIKTKLGEDHPHTLAVMNNLAVTYQAAGRLEQAIPILEEALRGAEKKLGKEHPQTLGSMGNLASGYKRAGHLDKAVPLFEKTLQLRRKHLGDDHPNTLNSMNNLARAYQAADRLDDAMPLFNDTLRMRREKLGYAHPDSHQSANNLAEAFKALGQADNVVRVRDETLRLEKQHLPEDHPLIVKSMGNLVIAYMEAIRLDQALEALREFEEKNGAESLVALQLVNNLAVRYRSQGELDKALSLFEESLQRSRRQLGQDHPQTLTVMINQAQALEKARRLVEAEALTRECLTIQKEKMPDHWLRFIAASVLERAAGAEKVQRSRAGTDRSLPGTEATRNADVGQSRP
ncbi:MAG: tetratricopeptide repeat protein [Pirellulaceae bacterium]